MSDFETTISVIGIDDLQKTLERLIKKVPNKAGELLHEEGLHLRKDIVNNAREMTDTKRKSKKSLGKLGSYRVSQVQGYGENMYVEIYARSPHFHLVERGHAIVMPYGKKLKNGKKIKFKTGGQVRGTVTGKYYMEKSKKKETERMPEIMDSFVDSLLKEADLL